MNETTSEGLQAREAETGRTRVDVLPTKYTKGAKVGWGRELADGRMARVGAAWS